MESMWFQNRIILKSSPLEKVLFLLYLCSATPVSVFKTRACNAEAWYNLELYNLLMSPKLRHQQTLVIFVFPQASCWRKGHIWSHISNVSDMHAWSSRLTASQSRTFHRLTRWLTRGYELLKVSLTAHVSWLSDDLIYGSRSTVWPVCVFLFLPACDEWTVLSRPDLYHDVNRFGHSAVFSDRWWWADSSKAYMVKMEWKAVFCRCLDP